MARRDKAKLDLLGSGNDDNSQSRQLPRGDNTLVTRPYMLPADLPKALAWLSEEELEALGVAVGEERRRRLLASESLVAVSPRTREPDAPTSLRATEPRSQKTVVERPRMTIARVSAIRAGFKAGVKPSMLARQFGVTLAAIRHALTETGS